MESTYSIGEIAKRFGLTPSALRYYESLGLLPEPERSSGRRRYDQAAIDLLSMLRVAQQSGFTLREAGMLLGGLDAQQPPSGEWRELSRTKLAEVEAVIARAEAMRALLTSALDCECLTLEDIDEFRAACVTWAGEHASPVGPPDAATSRTASPPRCSP